MTQMVDFIEDDIAEIFPRRQLRCLSQQEFIEQYGSGTLRKSQKLGFNIQEAYLKERVRFEFGHGFEILPRSRITYSAIKLESCQAITELGWHAERMIEMRPFASDSFICKQFEVEYANEKIREGAGILVEKTSAPWLPAGYMIFCIVTEKKHGIYQSAINPF